MYNAALAGAGCARLHLKGYIMTPSTDPWTLQELQTADLGDPRLNERFQMILEAFADRPQASIPAASGGRAELEAAYRFCDNKKVTPEKLLQPHFHATTERCKKQKVVLCPQDTSELDFTRPAQQVQGAGPLDGTSRRGAFLHLTEAFTEDGTPLGAIHATLWSREMPDDTQPKLSKTEKRKQCRALPIEQKESIRWLEGIRTTQQLAEECPDTLCVSLSDSEGDIYELFAEPRTTDNFHWIVRACQNRQVLGTQRDTTSKIRETLLQEPVLLTNEISVRGRDQKVSCETRPRRTTRISRQAMVEVRACAVTIKAPKSYKGNVASKTVHVVLVFEPHPPADEHAIEWILLTTLPISTLEEVCTVIHY